MFKLLTGSVYVGGDKEGNKADNNFRWAGGRHRSRCVLATPTAAFTNSHWQTKAWADATRWTNTMNKRHLIKGNRRQPDSDSEVLVESFQAGNCIKIPYIVWNWECTFTFLKIDFDWGLKLNSPQNKITFKLKMFSKVTSWRTSVHSCFSFC